MKIIYNNIIPFPGFKAINLFGVLFGHLYYVLPKTLKLEWKGVQS